MHKKLSVLLVLLVLLIVGCNDRDRDAATNALIEIGGGITYSGEISLP